MLELPVKRPCHDTYRSLHHLCVYFLTCCVHRNVSTHSTSTGAWQHGDVHILLFEKPLLEIQHVAMPRVGLRRPTGTLFGLYADSSENFIYATSRNGNETTQTIPVLVLVVRHHRQHPAVESHNIQNVHLTPLQDAWPITGQNTRNDIVLVARTQHRRNFREPVVETFNFVAWWHRVGTLRQIFFPQQLAHYWHRRMLLCGSMQHGCVTPYVHLQWY